MMSDVHSAVTLIVKAPNQQIEDQTVECELSWTVRRLKGHLAEVYPNNPRAEEQRLIYSGHLLNDSSTLGEVLRTADGQKHHSLHLVCAHNAHTQTPGSSPRASAAFPDGLRRRPVESSSAPSRSSDASSSETSSSDAAARDSSSASSIHSSAGLSSSSSSGSSTDPRLSGNAFFLPPPPPPMPPHPSSSLDSPLEQAADFQNMQSQYMAYMQQAYAQYMMQYMQFMVANGGQTGLGVQWPTGPSVGAAPASAATPSEADRQQANAAAAQREPAARVDENGDNDDPANRRDWLEWMYFVVRMVVLFMLVYAYSSPLRFAVVSILGICVYLYQRGYFRLPPDANYLNVGRVPDNNNEPHVVDAAEQAEAQQENADVPSAAGARAADAPAAGAAPPGGPSAGNAGNPTAPGGQAPAEQARPSLLALTWAFFTCFFTSIIPERPVIP